MTSLQVSSLQEELKRRESRWNASSTRFRKRIDELENENQELKEELKMLEKERLERWAQSEKVNLHYLMKIFLARFKFV